MIGGTDQAIKSHSRGLASTWNKLTEMMWKLNCCCCCQVHYLDEHAVNAYEIFVNTEPFLRCVTTSQSADVQASLTSSPKANTCYTAGATQLREGDKLFLRDVEPMRYSVLQPSKTFFGLIRLAPISEYP